MDVNSDLQPGLRRMPRPISLYINIPGAEKHTLWRYEGEDSPAHEELSRLFIHLCVEEESSSSGPRNWCTTICFGYSVRSDL